MPGLALCLAVTGVAFAMERGETAAFGATWLEALVLAILVGTAVRTAWTPGPAFTPGIAFTAVLGVLVVLGLPLATTALHVTALQGGVLAAAAPMGAAAVQMGTLVKLVRVLMLGMSDARGRVAAPCIVPAPCAAVSGLATP